MQYETIIVGAGIVGMTAALGLASYTQQLAIIDKGAIDVNSETNKLRVYAINQASKRLFDELGVWELLNQQDISSYQHMHVWDAKTKASIDFDSRIIHDNKLGFIIAEASLKRVLIQKIQATNNIVTFPSQGIEDLVRQTNGIRIISKTNSWETPLLLVADGANSQVRQKLQVPIRTYPYHQEAIIATVRTEKPHQKTAWQIFNTLGCLAFLPLPDAHLCSIVWSTSKKQALQLKNCSEESFNQALEQAFAATLGSVAVQSERQHFPLIMRDAFEYVGNNWLLLGDAAHTIHPLAGLGLNIGLKDVAAVLSLQKRAGKSQLRPKILRAYQRERKSQVWQTIALVGALKTLFTNPLPPVAAMRGLGLKICDKLSSLKRLFIEHAND